MCFLNRTHIVMKAVIVVMSIKKSVNPTTLFWSISHTVVYSFLRGVGQEAQGTADTKPSPLAYKDELDCWYRIYERLIPDPLFRSVEHPRDRVANDQPSTVGGSSHVTLHDSVRNKH